MGNQFVKVGIDQWVNLAHVIKVQKVGATFSIVLSEGTKVQVEVKFARQFGLAMKKAG